jgi:hypothetical protein
MDEMVSSVTLRLNIYVKNGIKMSKQPLIGSDGTSPKPSHFDGLRHTVAQQLQQQK